MNIRWFYSASLLISLAIFEKLITRSVRMNGAAMLLPSRVEDD